MIFKKTQFKKIPFLCLCLALSLFSCEDDELREVILYDEGQMEATASTTDIEDGETITYKDLSTKAHTRTWTFEGGTPETSTEAEVDVMYEWGGSYTTTLVVSYIDNQTETKEFNIEVEGPKAETQEAFGGEPVMLPARIEFEDYDIGGEGIAYHDTEPENLGGEPYRDGDGVDIQLTEDVDGEYNVGYSNADEWLEYTVEVPATGFYDFDFRVASGSDDGGSSLKIQKVDGEDVEDLGETGDFPNTGGWQAYTTLTVEGIELTEGVQVLRMLYTGGGINVNWFQVRNQGENPPEEGEDEDDGEDGGEDDGEDEEENETGEKYAIYTEDGTAAERVEIKITSNKQFIIEETNDAYEGAVATSFSIDGSDSWAMASVNPVEGPVDISGYINYNLALKSDSDGTILIRLQGGGENAILTFDAVNEQYGFKRDGQWHAITIPLTDFTDANPALDLTQITDFLVFRSEGDVRQSNNYTFLLDDFYLSK